ncbi:MAG: hypothetical protein RLZZ232_363 [Planctomycetota bacterium]|jgi:hypothetical protein
MKLLMDAHAFLWLVEGTLNSVQQASDDSINTFCHQHGNFDGTLIIDDSLLWNRIRE